MMAYWQVLMNVSLIIILSFIDRNAGIAFTVGLAVYVVLKMIKVL